MLKQKKYTQVDLLTENLTKNTSFVLVKFDKTTHQSLESLRRDLKKTNSSLKVLKNTLFAKTINKLSSGNRLFADFRRKFLPLKEPSAILTFGADWSEGLHKISEFMQKEKTISFKLGILDNQIYESADVTRIAKLPSKKVLLANLIGSLKSPASHLTYALKFNMTKLVYILQQKSKK